MVAAVMGVPVLVVMTITVVNVTSGCVMVTVGLIIGLIVALAILVGY